MAEESGVGKNVRSGFFWKAMENGGDQLVTFFISIVLARLLGPDRYGTMATMLIFVSIGNVIVQNGFQTSLIQKKKLSATDISSAFWMGLFISILLYVLVFVSAPTIATFFDDPEMTLMLRVLAILLLIGAVTSVEIALIARRMDFRLQCLATIFADVISGIAGVLLAFNGAGTWALIFQQLIKNILFAIFLIFGSGWFVRARISAQSLSSLLDYGWKVLVSGLIDTIYTNIYTPFISRLYDASTAGLYNRGNQFPQAVVNAMAAIVQSVMLPGFAQAQDDKRTTRRMLRVVVKLLSFIMFPAMLGLSAVAEPLIMLLLGEEWLEAAPLMRFCCISYSVWHIHVANLQAINANGRSDIYLRLEVIKKTIGILTLILSIPYGIRWMLIMRAVFDFMCVFINAFPNARILRYGPVAQWRDVIPELMLSIVMCVIVTSLRFVAVRMGLLASSDPATWDSATCALLLVSQVGIGIVIYIAGAVFFRMRSLRYIIETLRS